MKSSISFARRSVTTGEDPYHDRRVEYFVAIVDAIYHGAREFDDRYRMSFARLPKDLTESLYERTT